MIEFCIEDREGYGDVYVAYTYSSGKKLEYARVADGDYASFKKEAEGILSSV